MILQVVEFIKGIASVQERKHCFEMDMPTKENLYLITSYISTRACAAVSPIANGLQPAICAKALSQNLSAMMDGA
jgi:hypothetical protein